jgi:N-methylhydantoinase B
VPVAINAPLCNSASIALYAVRALIREDVPVNDGLARVLDLRTTPGTVADARFPAPVASRGLVLYRLWDALLGAIAQLLPDRAMACGDGGYDILVFSGKRPDGSAYVLSELLCGSWGGRTRQQGVDGCAHPIVNMSNTPIEMLEVEYPLLVTEYTYVPDSFGDGEFRGGCAIRRGFRALEDGVSLGSRGGRRRHPSWGVSGGGAGAPSSTEVRRADGSTETLEPIAAVVLDEGDVLVHSVCGAGGLGDAALADPERVARDREDGLRVA